MKKLPVFRSGISRHEFWVGRKLMDLLAWPSATSEAGSVSRRSSCSVLTAMAEFLWMFLRWCLCFWTTNCGGLKDRSRARKSARSVVRCGKVVDFATTVWGWCLRYDYWFSKSSWSTDSLGGMGFLKNADLSSFWARRKLASRPSILGSSSSFFYSTLFTFTTGPSPIKGESFS